MAPSLYEFQSILALGEIALRGRPSAQRIRASALQMSAFMVKRTLGSASVGLRSNCSRRTPIKQCPVKRGNDMHPAVAMLLSTATITMMGMLLSGVGFGS